MVAKLSTRGKVAFSGCPRRMAAWLPTLTRKQEMKFEDLALMAPLTRAVAEAGYVQPTPIQEAAIPIARAGRDLIGCARTGTGKTAAFCLPALQLAYEASGEDASLHTLILTPTRELAAQIGECLTTYGKHVDLWHTVVFGGVNEKPQIAELKRGVDILVATPGRLLDLMQRGFVRLNQVKLFVLDEADRMLDMGFINDVKKVVKCLPRERQTLFFSATMPPPIRKLANSLVRDAQSVSVDPVSSTVEHVTQRVYFTDKSSKPKLLLHLLEDRECTRVVVFARTKHGSDRVSRHLVKAGVQAAAIHGNKSQNARTRALEGFRTGKIEVLVATDLAARGIDVDDISHVVNYDLPNIAETYVHRVGRTARAGKSGIALSLCDAEEQTYLHGIERLTKRPLDRMEAHPFARSESDVPEGIARPAARPQGGAGRQRRSSGGGRASGRPQVRRSKKVRGGRPRSDAP